MQNGDKQQHWDMNRNLIKRMMNLALFAMASWSMLAGASNRTLPELVAAAKHLQQNWGENLAEPMARLNQTIDKAETINRTEESKWDLPSIIHSRRAAEMPGRCAHNTQVPISSLYFREVVRSPIQRKSWLFGEASLWGIYCCPLSSPLRVRASNHL